MVPERAPAVPLPRSHDLQEATKRSRGCCAVRIPLDSTGHSRGGVVGEVHRLAKKLHQTASTARNAA